MYETRQKRLFSRGQRVNGIRQLPCVCVALKYNGTAYYPSLSLSQSASSLFIAYHPFENFINSYDTPHCACVSANHYTDPLMIFINARHTNRKTQIDAP